MIKKVKNNKIAIIVLHEIYGINRFIEDVCSDYNMKGFDVFCPDMLQRTHFLYSEAAEAYHYFINEVGFDFYKNVEHLIEQLKLKYNKVLIIGFSVGATIAWKCCENLMCDGVICCYGSRIRDYMLLQPRCPVLLIFAQQDSFDVESVISKLQGKPNIEIHKVNACHGFMDKYSECFDQEKVKVAKAHISGFIKDIQNNNM